ncbi:LCP family protein [Patescibacteria group bacterium]|nr:LCP family protein [Patescibacteria group bacterium]
MIDSIKPPKKIKVSGMRRIKENRKTKMLVIGLIILILIIPGFYLFKTGLAFSKIITIKNISWEKIFGKLPASEFVPEKDEDRINVLLLGIRGEEDINGGLLSDGIMIVSFKKSTGQVALISIPRDLYLQFPGESKYEKINAAYVVGLEKYDNGLDYAKKTISYISDLYIDYAAVINFESFKDVIDLLGGITIHLDNPFIEEKQWFCDESGENCTPFVIEAGDQVLNGEKALLYSRSRFSSNDFDRARRQQQVLLALKDKILSLGILKDPLKIGGILDVLSKNLRTDVSPWEMPGLVELAKTANMNKINKIVFESSEHGLLYETKINGIYVLLPTEGNFSKIREACKSIFEL